MAAFVSSGLAAAPRRRAAAATAAARRFACRGRPAGNLAAGPSRRVVAVPTASAAEAQSTEAPTAEPLVGSSDRAAALPWQTSVAGEEFPLLFMDFIVHMLGVMKGELTGVADLPFEESLSLQTGKKRVRLEGSPGGGGGRCASGEAAAGGTGGGRPVWARKCGERPVPHAACVVCHFSFVVLQGGSPV